MEPTLPKGALAVFRAVDRVAKDDIVLVDHPDAGVIVRSVSAVSLSGRVALRALSRTSWDRSRLAMVEPDMVKGRLMFRFSVRALLPGLGKSRKAGRVSEPTER